MELTRYIAVGGFVHFCTMNHIICNAVDYYLYILSGRCCIDNCRIYMNDVTCIMLVTTYMHLRLYATICLMLDATYPDERCFIHHCPMQDVTCNQVSHH